MTRSANRLMLFQHSVFWAGFLFINLFVSFAFLPVEPAIRRFIIITAINIVVYIFSYTYPVNLFFENRKYFPFIAILLATAAISSLLRAGLLYSIDGFAEIKIPTLLNPSGKSFGPVLIVFTQCLVIIMAALLAVFKNKLIAEQKLAEILKVKTQTELSLLKAKINPHFLLNTLNNIYYYNQEEHAKSGEAIIKLGELLRYTIYESSKSRILLSREIDTLEGLRQLYSMRFQTEPNISIAITGDVSEIEIPPGIILILFENALKYSAVGSMPNSYITAEIKQDEKTLQVQIKNTIAEADRNLQNVYAGLGLEALKKILEVEYRKRYTFEVSEHAQIFTATLSIEI